MEGIMKKIHFAVYTILMALSIFLLNGCGGGSSSTGTPQDGIVTPEIKQVIMLDSPAIELNKRYSIYKGVTLTGMNGAKYFVANTGSVAVQSTMNLGFSEIVSPDEAFIVVNDTPSDAAHKGSVVFAYDPSGVRDEVLSGANPTYSGGMRLTYSTLSLTGPVNSSAAPTDAYVYKEYVSDRGTTKFAAGLGSNPSFVQVDTESYNKRDVPLTGNVLWIVRRVNTFSGIMSERW